MLVHFVYFFINIYYILCYLCDSLDILNDLLLGVDIFICVAYGFPSIGDINEVRSLLFCKSKTSSVISYHIQKTFCGNTYKEQLSRQQFRNMSFSWYSVYYLQKKHGWVIEKNMLSVNWMDQQPASETLMLLISCGCKTNCATKRYCVSQGLSCTDSCRCSDICQYTNRRESLSESNR